MTLFCYSTMLSTKARLYGDSPGAVSLNNGPNAIFPTAIPPLLEIQSSQKFGVVEIELIANTPNGGAWGATNIGISNSPGIILGKNSFISENDPSVVANAVAGEDWTQLPTTPTINLRRFYLQLRGVYFFKFYRQLTIMPGTSMVIHKPSAITVSNSECVAINIVIEE